MSATAESLRGRSAASPPGQLSSGYRGDVDGLRAIAVTLVVLFHAGWAPFSGGYIGVDVFFVLSGFLITGLLLREVRSTGTISLLSFYARRIRRLLPLSALVLCSTAVAAHFLTPRLDRPAVGGDIASAALYFANWHYAAAATQYLADTDKSPVLHYWSLCVEEQFYLVWPLLILLVVGSARLAVRRWDVARRRVSVVLAVIGLGSLALSATTSVSSGPFAYFGLQTRSWELAAGAALALLAPRLTGVSPLGARLIGWAGLAAILGSAVVMNADTVFPGTAALAPVLGTVMVVGAGGVDPAAPLGQWLSNPVARYLGRLSYAWYLWHWPCLVLAGSLTHSGAEQGSGTGVAGPDAGTLWVKGAAVVISLLLAVLSHHVLENPVRRSRWLSQRPRRSVLLGVAITVVSVTASVGLTHQSLPTASSTRGDSVDGSVGDSVGGSVAKAQEARTDTADVPNGCYQGLDTAKAPSDCLFGDPQGRKALVLAGDSNARFWFPAFDRLAKQRGWRLYFWGKSGCPLIDGTMWLGQTRSVYDTCSTWRTNVAAQIAQVDAGEAVDAVVLARSRATGQYLMVDDHTRAEASQRASIWREATSRTVRSLSAATRNVVLMEPIPAPPFDVPACIAEDPTDAGRRCAFPKGRATAPGPLEVAEREAGSASSVVTRLDLNQKICPRDPCPVVSDTGQVIYLNQNHLTAGYATSLWRDVGAALDPVVR